MKNPTLEIGQKIEIYYFDQKWYNDDHLVETETFVHALISGITYQENGWVKLRFLELRTECEIYSSYYGRIANDEECENFSLREYSVYLHDCILVDRFNFRSDRSWFS